MGDIVRGTEVDRHRRQSVFSDDAKVFRPDATDQPVAPFVDSGRDKIDADTHGEPGYKSECRIDEKGAHGVATRKPTPSEVGGSASAPV